MAYVYIIPEVKENYAPPITRAIKEACIGWLDKHF